MSGDTVAYYNAHMSPAERTRVLNRSFRAQSDLQITRDSTISVGDTFYVADMARGSASTTDTTIGIDYEVVRDLPGRPVEIRLLGHPGGIFEVTLAGGGRTFHKALIDGVAAPALVAGESVAVRFEGHSSSQGGHRRLADLERVDVPEDAEALYEATVFAADNNALEVRSLSRSGPTAIPKVRAARAAFFEQPVFEKRGIWDRNLFDGDPTTGFWPSRKYRVDQRVRKGCFRLDLGEVVEDGRLVLRVPDQYSLQPILDDEANWVEVSTDLKLWRRLSYLTGTTMTIDLDGPARYLRFQVTADRFVEISGEREGQPMDRNRWRASNLFAHPSEMRPVAAWHGRVRLEEAVAGARLSVAIEGVHGIEGAYAALKVGDRYIGGPDRAAAYPSNTWEYVNARRESGYTYYFDVTEDMTGQPIDVYVLGFDEEYTELQPVVWHTIDPAARPWLLLELE